ncbi:hypothetical protein KR018_012289 [Drosophila ironensis]|nr:hypothetical protein KR018_012289 [Drosophila ironensis]
MAAKRMDLRKRTFLVLSGSSNPLGKSLAVKFCQRLAPGSLALILDENEQDLLKLKQLLLQELKAETVQVKTGQLNGDHSNGLLLLEQALKESQHMEFERSIVMHNEGDMATQQLLEPQTPTEWQAYVQKQLYAPVALSQRWLQATSLEGVEKLAVNMTSTLMVRPLIHCGLLCSCKRARDMYFRSMAAEESRRVSVLSYGPGLMTSHQRQIDINGNELCPEELVSGKQVLQLPRVQPMQATLKLINILEEISFVSGHDVDYYDTFVL